MCLAGLEASKRIKNATFLKTFMQNLYLPSWMTKLLWLLEDYITIHFPYTTLFQEDYLKMLSIQNPPRRGVKILIASLCISGKQSCRELFDPVLLDKLENVCSIVLKCFDYKSVCNVMMVPLNPGHMLIPHSYRCLDDPVRVQELFSVGRETSQVVRITPVLLSQDKTPTLLVLSHSPRVPCPFIRMETHKQWMWNLEQLQG